MRPVLRPALMLLAFLGLSAHAVQAQPPASPPATKPVTVAVYPILVQAPVYGASFNVPSLPGGGGGGGSEGGAATTDWSFNSAYMGGFELYAGRVFSEVDVLWTKPSATHDASPRIDVSSEIWTTSLKGGFRVYKGLGITGGARRIQINADVTMEFPQSGTTLSGSTDRARWYPFAGADWHGAVSRKWTLDLSADFGGFGSDDSHTRMRARADWQVVPHVTIRAGYQLLHLALGTTDRLGAVNRNFTLTQTLYGPEFGIGFVF